MRLDAWRLRSRSDVGVPPKQRSLPIPRAAKFQGVVVLSLVVTPEGKADAIYVVKGAPFGLTTKARGRSDLEIRAGAGARHAGSRSPSRRNDFPAILKSVKKRLRLNLHAGRYHKFRVTDSRFRRPNFNEKSR